MSDRPEQKAGSEEPIELHTGDVQPLKDPSGESTVPASKPPPPTPDQSGEKPFDPESTLPLDGGAPFDPEVTDKGAFRPQRRTLPQPEEMSTDPTGRGGGGSAVVVPPPAKLFDGIPMPSSSGEKPVEISGPKPAPTAPVSDPAFLCVTRGPGQGSSVAVPEGEHPIGRSASCFLCIAHSSVSREHALFKRVGNTFFIRDAGSGSGTRINGVRLEGATAEIVPGDQIQIGASVLILRHGPVVGPEMTDPLGFTAPQAGPKKPSMVWLWVGAIATALGSAALASVLLSPFGERLVRGQPRPVALVQPAEVSSTEPPAPATAEPTRPEPPPPSDVNLDGEIEVKLARRDVPADPGDAPSSDPALVPVAAPTPAPAPPNGLAARVRRPIADPTAPLIAPPAPKPVVPTTKASEALRLFNEGEVEASINAAKASGSAALALKLGNFRKEAALAETSRSSGDAMGAVRHLSAAASIDEQLTRGWSKPGTEVRAELTRLLIDLGEKALGAGDASQAAMLLEKALIYGPGNEKATRLLKDAKAKKSGGAAAPSKDSRGEADKAFEN